MKRDLPFPMPRAVQTTGGAMARRVPLVSLAIALAWIIGWYAPTAALMVHTWANSETFAHGFIVVPVVAWLIWRVRHQLAVVESRPDFRMLPLLGLTGCAWLAAKLGSVNVVSQAALVAMVVLAVPTVMGMAFTRRILFPLGFLFFCVPVGAFLLPMLMERTADFTVVAVRASGVPVYREGLHLVIPTGRWSIVEACSGVRYLIASLMVGTLFAYLNYRTMWRRWVFVGVSIVVPIVANWLRAYMIVMLGHLTNNRLAVGVDHIIYGWVFFGIVMVLMFWVGSRWREASAVDDAHSPAVTTPVAAAQVAAGARSPLRFFLAAAAIVAVTVPWPLVDSRAEANLPTAPVRLAIGPVPEWSAARASDGDFEPRFVSPSAVVHGQYDRGSGTVGLYVAYYRGQTFDRKVVSSENRLPIGIDDPWNLTGTPAIDISVGGQRYAMPLISLVSRDGRRLYALKWYWVDGVVTPSDARAKAQVSWSRITGRGDDAAAIVVYSRAATVKDAQTELQRFVDDAWPPVATALAKARELR